MFIFTNLLKVGRRGPFHTDFLIVPNRRFNPKHVGFNPKAVASFTRRANRLSRSTPSQNHMWGVGLDGKLDS